MRELARLGIGEVLARQGRYGEARDFMEWALAALGAVGDPARQASALASLIRLYTTLGDVAQARANLEQLDRLVATGVVQYDAVQWALVRAVLAERAEDVMLTIAAAERALAAARQTGQRQCQADALVIVGRTHERAERCESAEAAYAEALTSYEGLGRAPLTAVPRAGLARVALARSEEVAALAQIEQVLEIFAEYPWAGLDDPFELYLTCFACSTRIAIHAHPRCCVMHRSACRRVPSRSTTWRLRRSFMEVAEARRTLLQVTFVP
jgi:tetratricopeptide (TPR) repeat protein